MDKKKKEIKKEVQNASDQLDKQFGEFNKLLKSLPLDPQMIVPVTPNDAGNGYVAIIPDFRRAVVTSLHFLTATLVELRDDVRQLQNPFDFKPKVAESLQKEVNKRGKRVTKKPKKVLDRK